jgi:hypothetical protein
MLKLVGDEVPSIESFMTRYRVNGTSGITTFMVFMGLFNRTDGSSSSIAQAESRCPCYRGALERSRSRDGQMDRGNDAGEYA